MRGRLNILPTLLAILAMLIASAWTSQAVACQIDVASGGGSTITMPAHHQHHRAAPAAHHETPGSVDPRLDCAACMGVMPVFPTMEHRELMPFAPIAQSFPTLTGVRPAIDPPPPRGA